MDKILLIIYISALVCAVMFFKICLDAKKRAEDKKKERVEKQKLSAITNEAIPDSNIKEYLLSKLKNSKLKMFSYDYIYDFLRKNGKIDGVGKQTTPEEYMLVKLILGFGVFLIMCLLGAYVLALPALVLGFYLEDLSVISSNKGDNRKMIKDISKIYNKLSMQLSSNIYVAKTFYDCYYYSTNKRLKKALLELNASVEITHDLKSSLADFKSKFNNDSIDSLVIIIEQAAVSGNTVESLNSIRKENSRVNIAELYTYKEDLTRQLGMCAIMIFGFTALILVYSLLATFNSDLGGFFTLVGN